MNSSKKAFEKKMLIRKTISSMEKQIQKLEEKKGYYIKIGKEAKAKGLESQFKLAVDGLGITMAQQKRVLQMKLNFEITSQMKDVAQMTSTFLEGMGQLSKEMLKITKEKDFLKVEKEFQEAMESSQLQVEHIETFMEASQDSFSADAKLSEEDKKEINSLMEVSGEETIGDKEIEEELIKLAERKANM